MNKTHAKYWTEGSIFCYQRGCKCDGCYIKDMFESPCRMKAAVFELVRMLGAPPTEKAILTKDQQTIIDAILDGANSFEEIAKNIGKKPNCVRSRINKMYYLAEADGVIYKSKGWKFEQFVQWVRNGGLQI